MAADFFGANRGQAFTKAISGRIFALIYNDIKDFSMIDRTACRKSKFAAYLTNAADR